MYVVVALNVCILAICLVYLLTPRPQDVLQEVNKANGKLDALLEANGAGTEIAVSQKDE